MMEIREIDVYLHENVLHYYIISFYCTHANTYSVLQEKNKVT